MSANRMKSGDILLFHDGEMAQVIDVDFPVEGMTNIFSMYDDEAKFQNTSSMKGMYDNLGQEGPIRALFHSTQSIHQRLNKLGKV